MYMKKHQCMIVFLYVYIKHKNEETKINLITTDLMKLSFRLNFCIASSFTFRLTLIFNVDITNKIRFLLFYFDENENEN